MDNFRKRESVKRKKYQLLVTRWVTTYDLQSFSFYYGFSKSASNFSSLGTRNLFSLSPNAFIDADSVSVVYRLPFHQIRINRMEVVVCRSKKKKEKRKEWRCWWEGCREGVDFRTIPIKFRLTIEQQFFLLFFSLCISLSFDFFFFSIHCIRLFLQKRNYFSLDKYPSFSCSSFTFFFLHPSFRHYFFLFTLNFRLHLESKGKKGEEGLKKPTAENRSSCRIKAIFVPSLRRYLHMPGCICLA